MIQARLFAPGFRGNRASKINHWWICLLHEKNTRSFIDRGLYMTRERSWPSTYYRNWREAKIYSNLLFEYFHQTDIYSGWQHIILMATTITSLVQSSYTTKPTVNFRLKRSTNIGFIFEVNLSIWRTSLRSEYRIDYIKQHFIGNERGFVDRKRMSIWSSANFLDPALNRLSLVCYAIRHKNNWIDHAITCERAFQRLEERSIHSLVVSVPMSLHVQKKTRRVKIKWGWISILASNIRRHTLFAIEKSSQPRWNHICLHHVHFGFLIYFLNQNDMSPSAY